MHSRLQWLLPVLVILIGCGQDDTPEPLTGARGSSEAGARGSGEAGVRTAVGEGDLYAFLVAVREYDPAELTSLQFTEKDVTALSETLKGVGYDEQNILLMTQTAGASRTRMLPTGRNIQEQLSLLVRELQPADTLLLAFSGHGLQFKDEDDSYYCPADARLADRSTLISMNDVYTQLESNCLAGTKILLMDACRNDPLSSLSRSANAEIELDAAGAPQRVELPGSLTAFFSCSAGEKSYEHPDLGHGVFFNFVIEALSGEADFDKDGGVSLAELELFSVKQTQRFVRLELSRAQTPERRGESRGIVTLARLPVTPAESAPVAAASVDPAPVAPANPATVTTTQVVQPATTAPLNQKQLNLAYAPEPQKHRYDVAIQLDNSDYTDELTTTAWLTVQSADQSGVQLSLHGQGHGRRKAHSGFRAGFATHVMNEHKIGLPSMWQRSSPESISIDRFGRQTGRPRTLSALFDLSHLLLERLSPNGAGNWNVEQDVAFSYYKFVETRTPGLGRFPETRPGLGRVRFGQPEKKDYTAAEKIEYRLQSESDKLVNFHRKYSLTSKDDGTTEPRLHVDGEGAFVFDRERGLPSSADMKFTLVSRMEEGEAVTVAGSVTYRLVPPQELAQQEAARQAAEAEAAKNPNYKGNWYVPATGKTVSADTKLWPGMPILWQVGSQFWPTEVIEVLDDGTVRVEARNAGAAFKSQVVPRSSLQLAHDIVTQPFTAEEKAALLADMKSSDSRLAGEAVDKLKLRSQPDADPEIEAVLIEAVQKGADGVRLYAADGLGTLGTAESVPALIKALADTDYRVQMQAMKALSRRKDARCVDPLLDMLENTSNSVRGSAALAVTSFGAVAEDAVIKRAGSLNEAVRIEVARLLGEIGTEKSLPALKTMLKDPSSRVSRQAEASVTALLKK